MMLARAGGVVSLSFVAVVVGGGSSISRADSVAQVATSKFLADETLDALDCRVDPIEGGNDQCNDCTGGDPEFCTVTETPDGGGSTTGQPRSALRIGDILTFRITFTPVPNGRIYGGGGYI